MGVNWRIILSLYRPYWRCYYANTDAIIYVVDSADRDRLAISKSELVSMLEVSFIPRLNSCTWHFPICVMRHTGFFMCHRHLWEYKGKQSSHHVGVQGDGSFYGDFGMERYAYNACRMYWYVYGVYLGDFQSIPHLLPLWWRCGAARLVWNLVTGTWGMFLPSSQEEELRKALLMVFANKQVSL